MTYFLYSTVIPVHSLSSHILFLLLISPFAERTFLAQTHEYQLRTNQDIFGVQVSDHREAVGFANQLSFDGQVEGVFSPCAPLPLCKETRGVFASGRIVFLIQVSNRGAPNLSQNQIG